MKGISQAEIKIKIKVSNGIVNIFPSEGLMSKSVSHRVMPLSTLGEVLNGVE